MHNVLNKFLFLERWIKNNFVGDKMHYKVIKKKILIMNRPDKKKFHFRSSTSTKRMFLTIPLKKIFFIDKINIKLRLERE